MTPWITTLISSLISAVISAVISGIIVTRINHQLDKRQKKREEDEKKKEETLDIYHLLIMQGIVASLSLGEATADAVESGKYNGKQNQARDYAEKVKHELQDFAYKFSAENLK